MYFNKIEFENFRQFRDKQSLKFDKDKDATVIYGPNGEGKSTLHQLFSWALFGSINLNNGSDNETIIYNKPLFNELSDGDKFKTWCKISFNYMGKEYFCERKHIMEKDSDNAKLKNFTFNIWTASKQGNSEFIESPDEFISRLLPEELRRYFFLSGEGAVADFRGKSTNLRKAISKILGYKLYNHAINDLGHQPSHIGSLYKVIMSGNKGIDTDVDKQLMKINRNIDHYTKAEENNAMKIEQLENEIAPMNENIEKCRDIISEAKSSKFLMDSLESSRKEKKRLEAKYSEPNKDFGRIIGKRFANFLVAEKKQDVINSLTEKASGKIIKGTTLELIKNLQNEDLCICGNKMERKMSELIKKLEDYLPPKDLTTLLELFNKDLENYLSNGGDIINDIDDILENYNDLYNRIDELQGTIEKLVEKLKGIENKEEAIERHERLIKRARAKEKEVGVLVAEKNMFSNHIRGLKGQLNKLTSQHDKLKKINEAESIIKMVHDTLKEKFSIFESEQKIKLGNNVQMIGEQIFTAKRKFKLHDDYSISIIDDESGVTASSDGQAVMTQFVYLLSLLKTLNEVSESHINKDFSLVLDAAVSNLDAEHTKRLMKSLTKLPKQVILMSKDSIDEIENKQIFMIKATNEQKTECIVEEMKNA